MARRNLQQTRLTSDSAASSFDLIDGAVQNLTDDGLLPDSAISYAVELANKVFSGPDGTVKTKDVPAFRSLVAGDIPSLDASKITTGLLALARGGTHTDLSGTGGTSKFLSQASAGSDITVVRPSSADLSDYTTWTTRAFAAGNYTANGAMTWTVIAGNVVNDQYLIHGKLMLFNTLVANTTVGGVVNTTLQIALPGGATSAKTQTFPCIIVDNGGGFVLGLCSVIAASTIMNVFRSPIANWTASVTATDVRVAAAFEIQ